MLEITDKEIKKRLAFDNPWWSARGDFDPEVRDWPRRAHFEAFTKLVRETTVRRAVILMGPRRVGKTVMIRQTIQHLIDRGVSPGSILYVSLDTPTYIDQPLEKLLHMFLGHHAHGQGREFYVFFDEVQYLKDWEVHLKSLVDSFRNIRFIASGSAGAALRLKSRESGAGRFTDFSLLPLTFSEFLHFTGREQSLIRTAENPFGWAPYYTTPDIRGLNEAFLEYINFGGYPEAAMIDAVRRELERYIRSDVIDKVLLRDLPSLYGISDVQELNSLLTTLANNTGAEISYEPLSKSSGVAKNTLRRYFEYLEASFLVRRILRVDLRAQRFRRATSFKVYLTNPSLRTALFGPISPDDEAVERLVETAIYAQWIHALPIIGGLHYGRWSRGEVDLIHVLHGQRKIRGAVEIKWSDRFHANPNELKGLTAFARENELDVCLATTRTKSGITETQGVKILHEPAALYCYRAGRHAIALFSLSDIVSTLPDRDTPS